MYSKFKLDSHSRSNDEAPRDEEGFTSRAGLLAYTPSTHPTSSLTVYHGHSFHTSLSVNLGRFLFGYNQQNEVGVTVWFLRLGCRKQAASASFLKYWLWNPELLCKQSNCSKATMLWGSPTNPQGENTRKSPRPWEKGGKWEPFYSRHPRGSEWLQPLSAAAGGTARSSLSWIPGHRNNGGNLLLSNDNQNSSAVTGSGF